MDIVSETKAEFRLRQWTKIIKECQASNLSAAAWCRQNNINIKSYYYWLRSAMGTGLLTTLFVIPDNWWAPGTIGTNRIMGIGVHIYWMSYINIWTVVTAIWALPGSSVMTASMNISCHFPANAGIFVRPAIKNEFSNLVNSYIQRYSNKSPIASGSLVSQKGSGAILCMTAACCPN